jgi:hypothetical protein
MDRFINHKDLGKVEILMSYQRTEDGKNLPKVVALATSTIRPVISEKWTNRGEVSFRTAYNNKGNVVKHHYLVWGTDDNFRESGFQHLTTQSGRKTSFNSALKTFNEARKATEFINFSKI